MTIMSSILGKTKEYALKANKQKSVKKAMNLREVLNLQNSEIGQKKSVSISDQR